jgi:ribonuclease P protein component
MGKLTFRKVERLTKEKSIQELFEKGSSFYLFPFKVFFLVNPDQEYPVNQLLFSVSKKNFKRAVDRNLIKRRMREAYRLQKDALPASPRLILGFIYTNKEILLFEEMKKKILLSFNKLSKIPFGESKPQNNG